MLSDIVASVTTRDLNIILHRRACHLQFNSHLWIAAFLVLQQNFLWVTIANCLSWNSGGAHGTQYASSCCGWRNALQPSMSEISHIPLGEWSREAEVLQEALPSYKSLVWGHFCFGVKLQWQGDKRSLQKDDKAQYMLPMESLPIWALLCITGTQ